MNFITSDIKKLYGKYLITSLASAVVMSIYSFVDSIAVGQSVGSIGAASMAVITPLYGVLIFLAILCGVGQAIQPIVSANCGAMQTKRIKKTWKMSLTTVMVMGCLFTVIGELFPEQIVKLFIDATPQVIEATPSIIRPFFLLFLFLGITVLATYHLQSIMHGTMSMVIAVLRSVVISGLLLFVLPLFLDITGVWIAMPISEFIVAVIALLYIYKRT